MVTNSNVMKNSGIPTPRPITSPKSSAVFFGLQEIGHQDNVRKARWWQTEPELHAEYGSYCIYNLTDGFSRASTSIDRNLVTLCRGSISPEKKWSSQANVRNYTGRNTVVSISMTNAWSMKKHRFVLSRRRQCRWFWWRGRKTYRICTRRITARMLSKTYSSYTNTCTRISPRTWKTGNEVPEIPKAYDKSQWQESVHTKGVCPNFVVN